MTRVNLPPGCYGFRTESGATPAVRPGSHVDVDDRTARALSKSQYVEKGMLSVAQPTTIGTRKGRRCVPCGGRVWQAWSLECPKCGAATEPE